MKCIFVGYSSTQKGYKCWDPIGKKLFVSMDVTFRESEPYYTKPCDLDLFLEEFSPVTQGDSREGENRGVATQQEVIVGTIPCPPVDTPGVHHDDGEGEEVIGDENEGDIRDDDGEVTGDENEGEVVGPRNEKTVDVQNEEVIAKKPIVYYRKRFRSQVEKINGPQPQGVATPVLNLSSDLSPPSGNVPSNFEHVELPLAQRRDPRSNFGKPPIRYGFEHPSTDHDIANFL